MATFIIAHCIQVSREAQRKKEDMTQLLNAVPTAKSACCTTKEYYKECSRVKSQNLKFYRAIRTACFITSSEGECSMLYARLDSPRFRRTSRASAC